MSISQKYINMLSDGVIIRGDETMPMEIRKTKNGVVFWKVGVNDVRIGSLDHILIFRDYKKFETKGVSKAIYCARSSIIKYKQIDKFIDTTTVIDDGIVAYKAKGLTGHLYSKFDGFRTLNYSDKFVSTMRLWEFMGWLTSSILFTPAVTIFAGLLTQDSSRIIRRF